PGHPVLAEHGRAHSGRRGQRGANRDMIDTQEFEPITPDQTPQARRSLKANPGPSDRLFRGAVRGGGVAVLAIMLMVGAVLAYRGWQALPKAGVPFFTA